MARIVDVECHGVDTEWPTSWCYRHAEDWSYSQYDVIGIPVTPTKTVHEVFIEFEAAVKLKYDADNACYVKSLINGWIEIFETRINESICKDALPDEKEWFAIRCE